jgi:hypothetical protein
MINSHENERRYTAAVLIRGLRAALKYIPDRENAIFRGNHDEAI